MDSSQNSQGEWQFLDFDLNWAEFTDELAYPWLNVCSLGPETVMVLWDDSLDTESGYRLEDSYWQQGSGEWSTTLGIDLPADYSGYCINGVQSASLYRAFCFPSGVSDPDTLCGFVKTYAETDISSDQALHYLPYAPVTATDYDNGIMAYTFIRGWSYPDRTIYYDHLLIKRQSGNFTLVELNRSEVETDFYITDVAVSDRSVYVSDDQGGLLKVHMPDAGTTEKSSLSIDFDDGHVKAMESRHGKIYMAIKYP